MASKSSSRVALPGYVHQTPCLVESPGHGARVGATFVRERNAASHSVSWCASKRGSIMSGCSPSPDGGFPPNTHSAAPGVLRPTVSLRLTGPLPLVLAALLLLLPRDRNWEWGGLGTTTITHAFLFKLTPRLINRKRDEPPSPLPPSSSSLEPPSVLLQSDGKDGTTLANGMTSPSLSAQTPLPPTQSHRTPRQELEWGLLNASASFGSLLIQLQQHNETWPDATEALDLDAHAYGVASQSPSPSSSSSPRQAPGRQDADKERPQEVIREGPAKAGGGRGRASPSSSSSPPPPSISVEAAKELDDAVVALSGGTEATRRDIALLPLGSLYASARDRTAGSSPPRDALPLSRPEHYQDRIGRDLRHLSITVASAAESVDQWRLFCQEGGGLYPLLETVREGAQRLRTAPPLRRLWAEPSSDVASSLAPPDDDEADLLLLAACNACRALRDVAALSPEVAAILTDGVLRANASWKGGFLSDLQTCLTYARDFSEPPRPGASPSATVSPSTLRGRRRRRREARLRSQLYVHQLLLAMTFASDDAVAAIRDTPGLSEAILACSSHARKEQTRRWLRYPGELVKFFWRRSRNRRVRGPFLEAATVGDDLNGQVQKTANLVLAAIGCNQWVPKTPAQRGLRILCMDGGGSRGMVSITALRFLMEFVGEGEGINVADAFDILGGTSTGGIISFLTGLRRETCAQASERYNQLIKQIFVKSALSTPRLFLTTASYDESHFMDILSKILKDDTMLDSRTDPSTPLVFAVTSKMSSTPTHVALFRNYNYAGGELGDHFTVDPGRARDELGIPLDWEHDIVRRGKYAQKEVSVVSPGVRTSDGSRHPGSFRVLQRYALRASTAAPTVFKPVMMGGEMYCDGGIVASNPTAIAIHEARTLFPDVPIEMVISIGTGGFLEQKSSPRIGWDGIIGQIVNSACDAEQVHHILEDILGDPRLLGRGSSASGTRYYRFNPVLGPPDQFPIDVTDPDKLAKLRQITIDYMNEPAQRAKMKDIAGILKGRNKWSRFLSR